MRWLKTLLVLALVTSQTTTAHATGLGWPVDGAIVTGYAPPTENWLPGHRGVDISSTVGASVRSAADGEVIFVGTVARKPVVVISHGGRRTTYEPVRGTLAVGHRVVRGQEIGTLLAGHEGCPTSACLHLGYKEGDRYLNPQLLLDVGRIKLLPAAAIAATKLAVAERIQAYQTGGLIGSVADGEISSPFGWRTDPFTGERAWHSGIDISAPCGKPIRAALPGKVVFAQPLGGYGLRVVVDHGIIGNRPLQTTYNHAEQIRVQVGQRVQSSQVIATIGTTGRSTGCHLHFEAKTAGTFIDPKKLL